MSDNQQMQSLFMITSTAGPHRDFSKDTRGQPFWNEHAAFIEELVDEGFILLGGPLVDEGGAVLIVKAETEHEVREKTRNDPWYNQGILQLESIKRWQIFIDERK
ncbi:MAG: YciI family protein [Dehalococcoidia bacterium]